MFSQCDQNGLAFKDLAKILPVVDNVAFKLKQIPAAAIQSTIELAIQENQFQHVRKLVPVFKDHPSVDESQVNHVFTKIVDLCLASTDPDQAYLLQLRGWLEPYETCTELVDKINMFFGEQAHEVAAGSNYAHIQSNFKNVDIELLQVANDHIRLKVDQGSSQDVPWTAIMALFGGHMISANRGYRGSVILRFKRKVFVCHFTNNQISINREDGEPLTFEDTWSLLKKYAPEDMPITKFREFRDYIDLISYDKALGEFLESRL